MKWTTKCTSEDGSTSGWKASRTTTITINYERFNKVRKTLPKLHPTASKDETGNVYLIVLNQDRADAVVSSVNLSTFASPENATVWTLTGDTYTAHNTVQKPDNVTIKESHWR